MTRAEADRIKAQKLKAFFRHIEKTYGLSEAGYRALYAAQGGKCYICRKATGKSRMLAVDHNHTTGEVRGLLCSGSQSANTCNRLIAIYSREALARAVEYTSPEGPPARKILRALEWGQGFPDAQACELMDLYELTSDEANSVIKVIRDA